jgi:hypothetical protein
MSLDQCLEWLYATALAVAIRENDYAFPWIESIHVLAITLVVGSIAIVDLRLLGLGSRGRAVTRVTGDVLPCTWIAFGVAAVSGLLMFASNATVYAHNGYFRLKLLLLGIAGLNMLVFQFGVGRDCVRWDAAPRAPWAARIAGGVSLVTWLGVVAAGRWIGFTILNGG